MLRGNHTKIKNPFTKAIAYLLIIIMLSSIITVPMEASMTITKNNLEAYNQEILDILTGLLGSRPRQRVLETMYKLGLLNGDGSL